VALYKYPQAAFPYAQLVQENRARGRHEPEFELVDTGVFDETATSTSRSRYAKADPEDLLHRAEVHNRGARGAAARAAAAVVPQHLGVGAQQRRLLAARRDRRRRRSRRLVANGADLPPMALEVDADEGALPRRAGDRERHQHGRLYGTGDAVRRTSRTPSTTTWCTATGWR
jgi:hypothetical protein